MFCLSVHQGRGNTLVLEVTGEVGSEERERERGGGGGGVIYKRVGVIQGRELC